MTVTTGEQKAALLLQSLPVDVAESVLAHLGPAHADRLRRRLGDQAQALPPAEQMQQALREFTDLLRITPRQVNAAEQAPTPPLTDVYLPSQRTRALVDLSGQDERPTPNPTAEGDPLTQLRELELPLLVAALRDEQLPTVVLVLGCLAVEQASEVLRQLPAAVRRDATLRLGRAAHPNRELLRTVARAVVLKGQRLASNPDHLDGDARIKKLADLLRNLEREDRSQVLEALAQADPEAAAKVKDLLYTFEDLLRIENRSLQALLAEIDMKTLAVSLRNAEEPIQAKVKDNLSMRARETLTEEMGLLGTVSSKQVRESQSQVVQVMQRLDQEGKLAMIES